MEGYTKAEVASDTLVALSRNHFSLVMYELQHHLKPLNLTDEFVVVTLAKLANGNGRLWGLPQFLPSGPAQGSLLVSPQSSCPHSFSIYLFFPRLFVSVGFCVSQALGFSISAFLSVLPRAPALLFSSPCIMFLSSHLHFSLSFLSPSLSFIPLWWALGHRDE